MIEAQTSKSLLEQFKESMHDGVLVQDMIISKNQSFTVFNKEQLTELELMHRQSATHKILTEFIPVLLEYQDNTFRIRMRSKLILDDLHDLTFTQLQSLPDSFYTFGRIVRLYIRLYVLK